MLVPRLHRQRLAVELITDFNLQSKVLTEKLLDRFLCDLCKTLGMTPIMGPLITTVHDGTSAFMMWMESGVQVHSWFADKFVSVDVYSCKPYYISDVLDCIEHWFEPIKLEVL